MSHAQGFLGGQRIRHLLRRVVFGAYARLVEMNSSGIAWNTPKLGREAARRQREEERRGEAFRPCVLADYSSNYTRVT